ncbi:MAG: hypothetical protein JNJ55_01200 [Betaproteobacteria bacterium]|nr:hypothetical protein [Betaproteobacteria bacterium]
MNKLMAIVVLLSLTACTKGLDRKINGTSESNFETSLAEIKKKANAEEVAQLDQALIALAVNDVSIGYEGGIALAFQKLAASKTPEQLASTLMGTVDGKTGREVVEMGRQRLKSEGNKQLAAGDKEIAILKQMRDENLAKRAALEGIEVFDATIRFSSVGPERLSVVDFKVRNGTSTGLSHLYLRGMALDPASGKPLATEDFNYKLSESPLLPGDTKSIRLPQGTRSKWNHPDIWGKEPLNFKVEVANAENLAGQKLTTAFTARDQARLDQLEANKKSLGALIGTQN